MTGMQATVPHYAAGELAESLFQPDTVAPAQFFDGLRRQAAVEPERELVLAILDDAVMCFQKYLKSTGEKERRILADTEEWFCTDDREWVFSFLNVCDILGMAPGYLRKGLLQWKESALNRNTPAELGMTMESGNDKRQIVHDGNTQPPNQPRRHTGGGQPKRTDGRKARAAGPRLAAVRKARAV